MIWVTEIQGGKKRGRQEPNGLGRPKISEVYLIQLHRNTSVLVTKRLWSRARALGILVYRELAHGFRLVFRKRWPRRYFERVVGGWQGKPLRRASQGRYERRIPL